MGEAKRRRAEIEKLKLHSPEQAAQWRRLQSDKRRLSAGIEIEAQNIESDAAMARAMSALFHEARLTRNVELPVRFLHESISASLRCLSDVPIACKCGCSHCCNIWVSVSAPEVLYIAKLIEQRGDAAIEKVRSAHQHTKDYDLDTREKHPYPCPLLEDDACSIYDARPKACRLAASADAQICARTYNNITNEDVPMPAVYLVGRGRYAVSAAAGLRHAGLPHYGYEFNSALLCALETSNAEERWLAGEDIFASIRRDPSDVFAHPQVQLLYDYAFPGS